MNRLGHLPRGVNAGRFDAFVLFRLLLVIDDVRRQKDQQFLASVLIEPVLEQCAKVGNVTQERDFSFHIDHVVGDHSTQHDRLTGAHADGGHGRGDVLHRSFDHVSVGGIREDRDPGAGSQLVGALLGVDIDQHHAVRADAGSHLEDQARLVLTNYRIGAAHRSDCHTIDDRNLTSDLNHCFMIVERSNLRAAENVGLVAGLKRPQQNADRFVAGRQNQPAESEVSVHATDSQAGQTL